MPSQATLIVFGGLPGTGKTAISRPLAQRLRAIYLRIDAIEQAMKSAGIEAPGAGGYAVANALAQANLNLGHSLVVDCVNPVRESRDAWREIGARSAVQLIEIEIRCSDPIEHKRRVEKRSADLPGHLLPTWDNILGRLFEPWSGNHLVLDTSRVCLVEAIDRAEAHVLEQIRKEQEAREKRS